MSNASAYASHHSQHRHAEDNALESIGHGGGWRMVKQFLTRVLHTGASVYDVFHNDIQFKTLRNEREADLLARILDELRHHRRRAAMELAVRRLNGVHMADKANDWAFCDALELTHGAAGTFLPDDIVKRTVNSVLRAKAIAKGTAPEDARHKPKGANEPSTGSGRRSRRSSFKSASNSGGRTQEREHRSRSRSREHGSGSGAAPSSSKQRSSGGRGGSAPQ